MPSVPTIPTFGPGPSSTAQLQQLADAMAFLFGPPIAKLRQTSPQTLTTAVNTAINWSVADWDDDIGGLGGWDAGTPSRFVCRYPGKYAVGGGCGFATNGTSYRLVRFAVNGIPAAGGDVLVPPATGGTSRIAARYQEIYLTISDYVEMYVSHAIGANLDTATGGTEEGPSMSIHWISR